MGWLVIAACFFLIQYQWVRKRPHLRLPTGILTDDNSPSSAFTPSVSSTHPESGNSPSPSSSKPEKGKLSKEQQKLFTTLEDTDEHCFVAGKAGTGKSLLLSYFAEHTNKEVVVLAPTGVAAMNVHGQTIHSFFRVSPGFVDVKKLRIHPMLGELLQKLDAIVIDEISMVRADMIDGIDHMLRTARKTTLPFGGIQMIVFGDMYQLPPVVEDNELRRYFTNVHGGPYFFNALVWQEAPLHIYELGTVFRQKHSQFKTLLDAIRHGTPSEQDFAVLRRRIRKPEQVPLEGVVTLTSKNTTAQRINLNYLDRLTGKKQTYFAAISGNLTANAFPTESELILRPGAQVMFVKNDAAKRWVNGTIGTVESLSKNEVKVKCGTRTYTVEQERWDKTQYLYNEATGKVEQDVIGTFTQFPLKLAWAITIHKSQGYTYDSVAIDLQEGAFVHGQTYVALSRCRSLKGLYLLGEITLRDIIVEPAIVRFMDQAVT